MSQLDDYVSINEVSMLLKFGASNFYSFREGFEISLELGAQCPDNISRGNATSSALCVKGANASGKTNSLKPLSFLHFMCCNSFNEKPDEDIPINSFFRSSDPTHLFCTFQIKGITYCYELTLTSKGIVSEKLSRKVKRFSPVFEREYNNITYCNSEFSQLNIMKLRGNASIISTANQYSVNSILPIYGFFMSITANVGHYGKVDISNDYRSVSEYYKNNPVILSKAVAIIKKVDLGISGVDINEGVNEDGKKYFFPTFEHDTTKAVENWLTFYDESLGTQTLYRTLPYFIMTLNSGGILVLDEFDTDYHPHILRLLISMFDEEETNPNHAQIIFSTHNTEILEYMSKYRTVLVNKDSSESYAYRLDEIPGDIIRNDRPIVPVYNSGKIGGVPRL